jgi:cytosine/adenosine deaminase-related metal-dependent hydrolase
VGGLLLKNGNVLDYFPSDLAGAPRPLVERVDLRMDGERVVERGPSLDARAGDEVIDLGGRTVMPGNINAHGHLYASLAAGMPAPRVPLSTFTDILTEVWWPLDRALDAEAVYLSAMAGAWGAVRCGTTLIFDHHASLSSVGGSLDRIEQALAEVGLRGCLCYEVTDRGGKGQRDITLEENERYLQKLRDKPAGGDVPRFRGLVGAHASFTLEDRTLQLLEGICSRQGAGLHIHLAEGTTDREVSRDRGWRDPLQRLLDNGLVRPGSIFAHGVDLSPLDMQTLEENGAWLIHCGRSNMNNGVGRAPVDRFPARSGVGTDGLDDNMWGELRTTFFRGNEGGRGPLGHAGAARLWLGNYRLAREIFGEPFGSLDAGAPADFIILNNFQKTPLTTDTWLSHLLFDFHPWDIDAVYVGGARVYAAGMKPPVESARLQAAAAKLWRAMGWQS